jgi:hypothetical protein
MVPSNTTNTFVVHTAGAKTHATAACSAAITAMKLLLLGTFSLHSIVRTSLIAICTRRLDTKWLSRMLLVPICRCFAVALLVPQNSRSAVSCACLNFWLVPSIWPKYVWCRRWSITRQKVMRWRTCWHCLVMPSRRCHSLKLSPAVL